MVAPVVVTDSDQRAALAITRSLGRAGYPVHLAGPRTPSLSGSSRFAASDSLVPTPLADRERFAAAVGELAKQVGARLVIPVTDAAVLALTEHRGLVGSATIPLPDMAVVLRAADKGHVLGRAAALGIEVPKQVVLTGPTSGFGGLRFPVVLKPARSVREAGPGAAKHSVSYAANAPELEKALSTLTATAFPLLLQEKIVGPGVGLFLLRWNGRTIARFAHQRLREKPPSGGVSVRCASVVVPDEEFRLAEALLEDLGWMGPAMVEFKREIGSQKLILMEVNGRFWGSLQLAVDAGVDFPLLLAQAAMGDDPRPAVNYRPARMRWWWGEIDHLIALVRRGDGGHRLGKSVAALVDIVTAPFRGVRGEVFRWNDWVPAWRESVDWIRRR